MLYLQPFTTSFWKFSTFIQYSSTVELFTRKKLEGGLRANGKLVSCSTCHNTCPTSSSSFPSLLFLLHLLLLLLLTPFYTGIYKFPPTRQSTNNFLEWKEIFSWGSAFVCSTSSNANIAQGKTDLEPFNLFHIWLVVIWKSFPSHTETRKKLWQYAYIEQLLLLVISSCKMID